MRSRKSRPPQRNLIQTVGVEVLESRLLFSTSPLSSIPALDSRPGAPVKIYLDFGGAPAQTWNGVSVPATPAFDIDGDPTTFSSQELADIRQIWAIVSEAYSPFNVDVTTVDPQPVTHNYPLQQSMCIIIGGNNNWEPNLSGISIDGSFSDSLEQRTSFVFSDVLDGNIQSIGEVAAQEAGHEFGLDLQSSYSGTTLIAESNVGNSLVGPIMGAPYSSQRAIWWNGPTPTSSMTIQDDMAVISSPTNGFGYAPLTVGQTLSTATPLTISAGSVNASGVIESTTQTDYYSFTTTGGDVTLNVDVAQYGAMLHAEEQIVDANGNVIATADNANTLGQTITTSLTAGTYYLVVGSYGQYGDVGQYTVTGTVASFSIAGASSVNEESPYTLSLSAIDPGQTVSGWVINWGDGNNQTVTGNPSSIAHTYATGPNSYSISATATDGTGTYNASNTVSVTVAHVAPTLTLSGATSVHEASAYTLDLSASDPGHTILSWQINWGDGNSQVVTGNPASVTHTFALGPNIYSISATATDDVGTYSASNSISLSIVHVPPTITLTGASSINEGVAYTLDMSAVELADHAVVSWSINWGDGNIQSITGNPTSTTHIFASGPNSHTISATATDDVGTYSAGNTVNVNITDIPPGLRIIGDATAYERSAYTLILFSFDPGRTISRWSVNWGDGNIQIFTGNPASVTHIFVSGPKSHTISATATDDVGTYSASDTVAVSVVHIPPVLAISGAASVYEPTVYTLGLSAIDPGHTILSWQINWGDGSSQVIPGNTSSVTHTYTTGPCIDNITATATDDVSTYSSCNSIPLIIHVLGRVDTASMNVISGWAFDPNNPTASANVEIAISGGPTQTFAANQTRSDLQTLLGSTNHGFTYTTPVLSVGSHIASIYDVESNGAKVLLATETLVSQNSLFDEHYYLAMNPDVAAAVKAGTIATGYDHYIQYGQYEGRSPSPYWNEAFYLQANPDVAAAVKAGTISSGFMHYYLYGQYENRPGLLYFNENYYLATYPDVAAAVKSGELASGFEHFVLFGQCEGRSPMKYFSAAVYDADNPSILPGVTGEVFSSNFEQFVEVGQYRGLIASNYYNEAIYLADNPDVAAAVRAGEFTDGFQHWLMYGQYEGRTAV